MLPYIMDPVYADSKIQYILFCILFSSTTKQFASLATTNIEGVQRKRDLKRIIRQYIRKYYLIKIDFDNRVNNEIKYPPMLNNNLLYPNENRRKRAFRILKMLISEYKKKDKNANLGFMLFDLSSS